MFPCLSLLWAWWITWQNKTMVWTQIHILYLLIWSALISHAKCFISPLLEELEIHHLVAILKCLWVPILAGILMYYLILRFSIWMVNFFECHVSSIFLCRVPTITNKWTHLFDCGFCCGLSFSVNLSSVTHSNCTWILRSRVLKLWTTGQLLPVVTFPATHRHHKDSYLNSFTIHHSLWALLLDSSSFGLKAK